MTVLLRQTPAGGRRGREIVALLVLLLLPFGARAEDKTPPVPEFVESLPESVQGVVQKMAEARDPPDRFLFSLFGLPRSRFGSGTTWLPDESPLYGSVPHVGKWGFMFTGNLFTGYDWFNSDRGWHRFVGRNTLNAVTFRTFRKSELSARVAISFEPLTIGERGYPLIAQTGQEKDGKRIHDRQYALDFFRELALTYSWEVTKNWAGTLYWALAGEPALGPVNFTQRISASADPMAPLVFHVQESSHASFGVFTVGAFTRKLKLEASWFNGSVPGKERYGLHIRKPDSYAMRVNYNPQPRWSLQTSYGFFERPVPSEPNRSDHRFSASGTYTYWYAQDAGLASTVSVGERITSSGASAASLMAESYWNIDGHNALFGRLELTQKTAGELVLDMPSHRTYAVGTVATGYVYYFGPFVSFAPGIGVRGSITPLAEELLPYYGTRVPVGVMVFGQLRTAALPFDG